MISIKNALLHTTSENSVDINYNHTEVQTGFKVYFYETLDFRLEFKVSEDQWKTYRVRIDIIRNEQRYRISRSCEIYVRAEYEAIRFAIKEALRDITEQEAG